MMRKSVKIFRKLIAVILCISIFITQTGMVYAEEETWQEAEPENVLAASDTTDTPDTVIIESQSVEEAPESVTMSPPVETWESQTEEEITAESRAEETVEKTEETGADYYKDGKICIYNYEQFMLIGSETPVCSGDKEGMTGTGDMVLAEGRNLVYGLDQSYYLMSDIPVDPDKPWKFPENFTGSVTSYRERTDKTLYDPETDTLYIFNMYSLEKILSGNGTGETVMSGDVEIDNAGRGEVVLSHGKNLVTYDASHNYVIASSFAYMENKTDECYRDGRICIYNYDQLLLIGSNKTLFSGDKDGAVGTGQVVQLDGKNLTYGPGQSYYLMNDIEMDLSKPWEFPDNFTGSLVSWEERADKTLYDSGTDSIYLYNRYQLELLMSDNGEKEPVMSEDTEAEKVGMGQVVLQEDGNKLTYGKSHRYVIASSFTEATPELLAAKAVKLGADGTDGRDFAGQVIKNIGGVEYILIGNEDQLRAIGTDKPVYTAVYQRTGSTITGWKVVMEGDKPKMLYGGDADLASGQNGTKDYSFQDVENASVADSLLGTYRCIVDQNTGEIDPKTKFDKDKGNTGHSYTNTENYIIFRDIDLLSKSWTPLSFSGHMLGAKAENGGKLWDGTDIMNSSDVMAAGKPVISNITIEQTSAMDVSEYMGVGFFGTITNEINKNNVGISAGTVTVSNLELQNVTVNNQTSEVKNTETILNFLTSGLGWLIGGLTDLLINVLTLGTVRLNLKELLSALLNARADDQSIFATGAFAGRIVGDVKISDCQVTGNVSVKNINDRTGGFVGYTEGVTQYDGLSSTLGLTVDVLASLLNAIPGLGLGDLITVLLKNGLDVGSLIPTGYKNPVLSNCSLSGLTGTVGASGKDYSGGFVGQQVGTIVENCSISRSDYNIAAANYGGGFAGVSRDAEIKGFLSSVGIELLQLMQPQSLIMNCSITNSNIIVSGGSYLGGFVGAQANSYAVNDSISGGTTLSVEAAGSNAGGFSGMSTVGWLTDLGKNEPSDGNLLGGVKDILAGLLTSDPAQAGMFLSLTGICPSAILGCQVSAASVKVNAGGDYAGGLLGQGDGVYLADSSGACLKELSYWKYAGYSPAEVKQCSLSGLNSISAKNYAGGIAGFTGTASVGGLLNGAIGLGGFLGFTVQKIQVCGIESGYTVTAAENYAGGAFGEAVGGKITDIDVIDLKSVTAKNRAGGFTGCAGPGDLAGADGLKLSLLGLDLLELKGLLSVAEGVAVEIENINVNGIGDGFTVEASGINAGGDVAEYIAGGFIGKNSSTKMVNASVNNLKSVKANAEDGYAGGFVGTSRTGGLADISDSTGDNGIGNIIQVGNLVSAVGYLIPSYIGCEVHYVNGGGVEADTAGGFAADFQSGTVNNQTKGEGNYYAVYDLGYIKGGSYAGGFGGKVYSGGLASVNGSGGLSILGDLTGVSLNFDQILGLVNAYVPFIKYAGVKSDSGFTVEAVKTDGDNNTVGSAGGFIGYGSGVQIFNSDVTKLKHTDVTPPKDLEAADAGAYFDSRSVYAITGGQYAGGYIGKMDVGDSASVGSGLKILGSAISLHNVLDVLSVVVSTIEHSNVSGGAGGYAVLANGIKDGQPVGMSGGYAGNISGGHIQDCHADNFSYVIGQISAGGYVGEFEPGNAANVLDNGDVLGGLLSADGSLLSVGEYFVPTIHNSTTSCIPCGGAVRAQAVTSGGIKRGMAGGYVGHNEGGQIKGMDNSDWKAASYSGPTSLCSANRILSVYGAEYAGGYTGLMECADTAKSSNLSLLYGLVDVNNLLSALSIVYPFEENTTVCGPLANLDYETWNTWVDYIGKNGGYGAELAESGHADTQAELDNKLSKYIYGYQVAAGRSLYDNTIKDSGCAGGYVGAMHSGVITNGQAFDVKKVTAMKSSGGFAGEMISSGAASLGSIDILGLNLSLDKLLNVADVFTPTIKVSSVSGYQSGLTVLSEAVGNERENGCGNAGGFVGSVIGGQIWGDSTDDVNPGDGCNVTNLRRVRGTNKIGGYAGSVTSGSLSQANTNASGGFLQALLNSVINKTGELASVLQSVVSTIRNAKVEAVDSGWGFVVEGDYTENGTTGYAKSAGGFAGTLEAAVLGDEKGGTKLTVSGLRGVSGGLYAGGFFGLADVGSVAAVSGNDSGTSTTTLLGLIQAGEVSVLDAFRTYVYYADVIGVADGIVISANTQDSEGIMSETRYTGDAGGFGGTLLNGSVKHSHVINLNGVRALNYSGGFVGHLGKNGTADIDSAKVGGTWTSLLGANAGVLDVFGSHVDDCSVTGIGDGYTVKSVGGESRVSGGFAGYADLSKINQCTAENLKKVASEEIAGGFIGRTNMNFIAETQINSQLVNALLLIVNSLVNALYLDDLQNIGLIDIKIPGIAGVKVFSEGDVLGVDLLGLKITAALSKADPDYSGATDAVIVTLGDSTIKLPCTESGVTGNAEDITPQLEVTLIKGNRTNVTNSSVGGILRGYDVYGGGASDDADGTGENGYSGGFIGYNKEGVFEKNTMTYCDVIRGSERKTGPFTGYTDLKSTYKVNTIDSIEADGNRYSVYRKADEKLKEILDSGKNEVITIMAGTDRGYNRYDVLHWKDIKEYDKWQDAVLADESGAEAVPVNVYVSSSKAVLMTDVRVGDNMDSLTPEPEEGQNPCEQTMDLTIQKIWKDWNDLGGWRPDFITVTIYQKYTDKAGNPVEIQYKEPITLTAAEDGSGWSATWKKVVTGLPVAVDDAGTICYCTYDVKETAVEGYQSTIETDSQKFVIVITNRHDPVLPFTGGSGILWLTVFGVAVVLFGVYRHNKRKKMSQHTSSN